MEDTTNMPPKASASLYNGQPTDTGLSCPSARFTSCTSSIPRYVRNGVSVENMPEESKRWFVLRVSYGRIIKAQVYIEGKGMPLRYKQITMQGKKRIVTEPLLPSFIFVRATCSQVTTLCRNVNTSDSRPLLSFYYDHTSFREDAPGKNPPLIISNSAMDNFIRLTSIKNPHVIPVTSEKYKLGDEVVVKEGEFVGIHGKVARIAGQQKVVVELFEGCLVATAYIPKEEMEKKNQ